MKKLFLSIAVLLIISVSVSAQTKYYKGEWTKIGTTFLYKAFVRLEFTSFGVQGRIIWTLIKPDSLDINELNYYHGRIKKSGVEIIEGDYNAQTKDLTFSGMNKIDPDSVIGVDVYTLKISADNNMIYGKTDANGTGKGFFYATLQNEAAAKKEFGVLLSKIK